MKLTAYRSEHGRFDRLARVYAAVAERASAGPDAADWLGALRGMDDAKGDLTVFWRDQAAMDRFSRLIDEIWPLHDPDPDIVHVVGENTRDLDRMPPPPPAAPAPGPRLSQGRIYAVFIVGFVLGALVAIVLL